MFEVLKHRPQYAGVAELADALVSGSSEAIHVGSSPVTCTRKRLRIGYNSESFSTKSTFSGGINRIYDEIPHAWDEIRLDGGWVDLISSKLGLDFICHRQISSRSDFIIDSRLRLDLFVKVWYNKLTSK